MSRRNGANRKQNRTSKLNSKTLCAHQHRTERQLLRDLSARSDKDGRSPALTNRMYVTTGYQEVWMTKLTSGIRGYHPHLPNEETETQKVTALSGNLPAEGHWEGLAQDLNVSSSAPELLLSVTVPSCAQKCLGRSTQIRFLEKNMRNNESCSRSVRHMHSFFQHLFSFSHIQSIDMCWKDT